MFKNTTMKIEDCYCTMLIKEKNEWSFKNERLSMNSFNNKIRDFWKIIIDQTGLKKSKSSYR